MVELCSYWIDLKAAAWTDNLGYTPSTIVCTLVDAAIRIYLTGEYSGE